jgi:hypothetical protein
MKCPNCNKELSDSAKFCTACGTPIPQQQPSYPNTQQNTMQQPVYPNVQQNTMQQPEEDDDNESSKTVLIIVIAVIAVLIVGIVTTFAVIKLTSGNSSETEVTTSKDDDEDDDDKDDDKKSDDDKDDKKSHSKDEETTTETTTTVETTTEATTRSFAYEYTTETTTAAYDSIYYYDADDFAVFFNDFGNAMCEAINEGNYGEVADYISKNSAFETSQKSLVSRLYTNGTKEYFEGITVNFVQNGEDGICFVDVYESEYIQYTSSSDENTYHWLYTLVYEDGGWKISDLASAE